MRRDIRGRGRASRQRGLHVGYRSVSFEVCSNSWMMNGADSLTWFYDAWTVRWRVFSGLSGEKRCVDRRGGNRRDDLGAGLRLG